MVHDLAEFNRARLDEDKQAALVWPGEDRTWQTVGRRNLTYDNGSREQVEAIDVTGGPFLWWEQIWVRRGRGLSEHIARHDPRRVLREVEAKQRIIERHPGATDTDECPGCGAWLDGTWRTGPGELCPEQVDLASVHADHPDYRQEWARERPAE